MLQLPLEVRAYIESFLHPRDYLNLGASCRVLHQEVSHLPDGYMYSSALLRVFPNITRIDGYVLLEVQGKSLPTSLEVVRELERISERLEGNLTVLWPGQREDTGFAGSGGQGCWVKNLDWEFPDVVYRLTAAVCARIQEHPEWSFRVLLSKICRLTYCALNHELDFLVPLFQAPEENDDPHDPFEWLDGLITFDMTTEQIERLEYVLNRLSSTHTHGHVRSVTFHLFLLGRSGRLYPVLPDFVGRGTTNTRALKLIHDFFRPFRSVGLLTESPEYSGPTMDSQVEEFRLVSLGSTHRRAIEKTLRRVPTEIRTRIKRLTGFQEIPVSYKFDTRCLSHWSLSTPLTLAFGEHGNHGETPIDTTLMLGGNPTDILEIPPNILDRMRNIHTQYPQANLRFLYYKRPPVSVNYREMARKRSKRVVFVDEPETEDDLRFSMMQSTGFHPIFGFEE